MEIPVVSVLLSAGEPQKDALPSPKLERSDVLPYAWAEGTGLIVLWAGHEALSCFFSQKSL